MRTAPCVGGWQRIDIAARSAENAFAKAGSAGLQAAVPLLQVRDLRTHILKPASFDLFAGECIAVRGPSGAGKTLLLRAIADLDANQGAVSLKVAIARQYKDRSGDVWLGMYPRSRAGGRRRSASIFGPG